MTGGVLFIVGIGVVLGIVSGSFMLAVIFIIRHRYNCIQGDPKKLLACKIFFVIFVTLGSQSYDHRRSHHTLNALLHYLVKY